MAIKFTRSTHKSFYSFITYTITKDGEKLGEIWKHSGFNFWMLKLESDPPSRDGSSPKRPGLDPCPKLKEAKAWVLANL